MVQDRKLAREEQLFSRLIDECTLDFSEELTLETNQDFIYLSDIDTYELYLISIADPNQMEENWKGYQGKKCYEVLQGRDSPCPFCTNHLLTKDKYYVWEYFNPIVKHNYILKDKLVDWHGKTVRLEVVMDVTDGSRVNQILRNNIEMQSLLLRCLQPLISDGNLGVAIAEILQIAGEFYQADRASVYYFGETSQHHNFSWHTKKEEKMQCMFSAPPSKNAIAQWREKLSLGRQIVLKDAKELSRENEEVSQELKRRGIHSLCATPIYLGKQLMGFLMMENIRQHWQDLSFLETLTLYLSGELQKEALAYENRRILYHDDVTGFQNFASYKIQAADILKKNSKKRKYSLWYCDLKNFKYINDVFGYDVGNRILKYWAELIAADAKEGETFTRVSADNFTSLRWYDDVSELKERFNKAAKLLEEYPETVSRKFKIELVSGVYLMETSEDVLSLEEMMNRANMAQKSVKSQPGSQIAFYTEEIRQQVLNELSMEAEMREALKRGEFVLYLQPQMPLLSGGDTARAEALVRWQRGGELVLPDRFIPLFEKNGMIVDLDLYVLEQACRYLRDLGKKHTRPLCLAVNVSRISMLQPNFVENYCGIKEAYGIEDGLIELEFTENIVVENYEQFRAIVLQLRKKGFLCAMDDFGTGQSSLNVLQNLPLDILKLDRRFFQYAGNPERGRAVIACVIALARKLSMLTVAKGIEQEEQAVRLKTMGCDFIQGFVYSRPVPISEFGKAFLEA